MTSASQRATQCWAVVPAAGAGTRMDADLPKQYLPVAGKTVLEHTLDILLACTELTGIVVAVAHDDTRWEEIGRRYRDRPLVSVAGGAQRSHSVLNALQQLAVRAHPHDRVLVHDAARPCLRLDDIRRLIECVGDDVNGGLLGVPVTDTMKRVDRGQRITRTVERDGLWHALTPQLFRLDLLRAALTDAIDMQVPVTDEASAMERAGFAPRMVQGQRDNIKITLPDDLALAAFYLEAGKPR